MLADEDSRVDFMFPSGVMTNETKKRVNPVAVGEDEEVVGDAGVAGKKKVSGGPPSSGFAMSTINFNFYTK